MIARVQAHNRLNGFVFVIGEFALIGLVGVAFAVLYLVRGNLLYGVAGVGIAVNSVVVIVLAARSLARRETGIGIWRIYTRPAVRAQIMREHPDLSKDTVLITFTVLVPFLLTVLVVLEAVTKRA